MHLKNRLAELGEELIGAPSERKVAIINEVGFIFKEMSSDFLQNLHLINSSVSAINSYLIDNAPSHEEGFLKAVAENIPISPTALHLIGVLNKADESIIKKLAHNVISQGRYEEDCFEFGVMCEELFDAGREQIVIEMVEGILESSSTQIDFYLEAFNALSLAVSRSCKLFIDYAKVNQEIFISEDAFFSIDGKTSVDQIIDFHLNGLHLISERYISFSLANSHGRDIIEAEKLIQSFSVQDYVNDCLNGNRSSLDKMPTSSYLAYLLLSSDLPLRWSDVNTKIDYSDVDRAVREAEDCSNDHAYDIFKYVIEGWVGSINSMIAAVLESCEKLNIQDDIKNKLLNSIMLHTGCDFTNIKIIFKNLTPGYVLDISECKPVMTSAVQIAIEKSSVLKIADIFREKWVNDLVDCEDLIEVVENKYCSLNDIEKHHLQKSIPSSLRQMCPSIKRHFIEKDLEI